MDVFHDRSSRRSAVAVALLATSLLLGACGDDGDEPEAVGLDADARTFRLVEIEQGRFDGETTTVAYRWNAAGEIVEERNTSSDDGLRVIALEYADGRPVTGEEDRGGDGTLDARRRYGYDDAGRFVLREVDGDLDGVYESSVAWEIDERGLAVATWSPAGCEPARCAEEANDYSRIFYENGRVARVDVDFRESPLDGVPDRRLEFAYDALGRLERLSGTDLDDGRESVGTFTYEEGPCDTDFLNSRFAYFCVAAPAADLASN